MPGLDIEMPEDQWQSINESPDDPSSRTHSQYGLFVLLQKLGVSRNDAEQIGMLDADLQNRAAIFSTALAPAKATSEWNEWRSEKAMHFSTMPSPPRPS